MKFKAGFQPRPSLADGRRTHSWSSPLLLVGLSLAAGAIAVAAVSAGLGPFATSAAGNRQPERPIDARALFPSPSPQVVQKVVDVYDPPAAVPFVPSASAAPAPAAPQPQPPPQATPTEPPEPGDGGGGDG